VVCSREEVQALLRQIDGVEALVIRLLYGTGMRVSEGLRLRVQDIHFDRKEITVRAEKEVSPYILTLLKKEVPYILTLLISVLYPVGLWRCGSG
jgi:integrase